MNPVKMNQMVNQVVEKIAALVDAGAVKNGVGVAKLAKVMGVSPEDMREICALAVKRGKLVSGKGRGGSFRLADRPHVQNKWGGADYVKGTWTQKHREAGFVSKARGQKRPRKAAEAVAPTEGAL